MKSVSSINDNVKTIEFHKNNQSFENSCLDLYRIQELNLIILIVDILNLLFLSKLWVNKKREKKKEWLSGLLFHSTHSDSGANLYSILRLLLFSL